MTGSKAASLTDFDAGTLARRYRSALRKFFERRLRDPSEAEDLAQDVLLRLTAREQGSSKLQAQERIGTSYIFFTARSVLMDKLRRDETRKRDAHCALDNADSIEVPSAEHVYSIQERIDRVAQMMSGLSPRVYEVFMFHRIEGMAYSEIATKLGISVSTVEKHMIAALRFLVKHAAEIEQ